MIFRVVGLTFQNFSSVFKTETSTTAVNSACLKSAQVQDEESYELNMSTVCNVYYRRIPRDFDKIRGPL